MPSTHRNSFSCHCQRFTCGHCCQIKWMYISIIIIIIIIIVTIIICKKQNCRCTIGKQTWNSLRDAVMCGRTNTLYTTSVLTKEIEPVFCHCQIRTHLIVKSLGVLPYLAVSTSAFYSYSFLQFSNSLFVQFYRHFFLSCSKGDQEGEQDYQS